MVERPPLDEALGRGGAAAGRNRCGFGVMPVSVRSADAALGAGARRWHVHLCSPRRLLPRATGAGERGVGAPWGTAERMLPGGRPDPCPRTAERARTLYFIAAAVLAALVPLILFAGLWVRAVLNQNERDLQTYLVSRAASLSAAARCRDPAAVVGPQGDRSRAEPRRGRISRASSSRRQRMVAVIPQWVGDQPHRSRRAGRPVLDTLRPFGSGIPPRTEPEIVRRVAEHRPARNTHPLRGREPDRRRQRRPALRCRSSATARSAPSSWPPSAAEIVQGRSRRRSIAGLLTVLVDERGPDPRAVAATRTTSSASDANEQLRNATAAAAAGLFVADDRRRAADLHRLPALAAHRLARRPRRRIARRSTRSRRAVDLDARRRPARSRLTLAGVLARLPVLQRRRAPGQRRALAASRALGELDARLLATTQEALAEQRKSASEREVLLREIYHRVKNNLQIIQSLLRLGSRDLEPGPARALRERRPADRRHGAGAFSPLQSPDLASIDFKDYLEDLVGRRRKGFGADMRGIRTELEAQSMRVPLDTAVPLAFITVEILTNAFKHAFPDRAAGVVRVSARQEGDSGVLTIGDDGVGVSGDEKSGAAPSGSPSSRSSSSRSAARSSRRGPGSSTYRVTFPLAPPPAGVEPAAACTGRGLDARLPRRAVHMTLRTGSPTECRASGLPTEVPPTLGFVHVASVAVRASLPPGLRRDRAGARPGRQGRQRRVSALQHRAAGLAPSTIPSAFASPWRSPASPATSSR